MGLSLSLIHICLGQNEVPKARRSVGNAVVMCLVSSLVLAALYLIFADNILAMFGGTVNAETYHHLSLIHILLPTFCADYGLRGIWYALFHSISAFCNAGFDLLGTEGAKFVS